MRRGFWIALLLLGAGAAGGAAKTTESDIVAHEWGTFLAVQGSDGVTLDGMYHEEHALPPFVHSRSRDQLALPTVILKGETPVIYFYTKSAQRVQVGVRFPRGIWTQWYPQAAVVAPGLAQTSSPLEPRSGRILWCADLIPAGNGPAPSLPATSKDALWNYARQVDAAYVRTRNPLTGSQEYERYLFYRGLGQAPLPLTMTAERGGTLRTAAAAPPLRHLFVLRVENGRGAYRYLTDLPAGMQKESVLPSLEGA
ncbi:MAG TPA: hypothetical protein VFU47_01140, partial [Armatimonadota bacterium]|nr:hypothetical protein [Armatimonadota bacterium]